MGYAVHCILISFFTSQSTIFQSCGNRHSWIEPWLCSGQLLPKNTTPTLPAVRLEPAILRQVTHWLSQALTIVLLNTFVFIKEQPHCLVNGEINCRPVYLTISFLLNSANCTLNVLDAKLDEEGATPSKLTIFATAVIRFLVIKHMPQPRDSGCENNKGADQPAHTRTSDQQHCHSLIEE